MEDYNSPAIGNEISCVMRGIDPILLNDNQGLKQKLLDALKRDGFHVLGRADYEFNPKGYTLVVLLAESHVSIHTYPEYNSLYFGLYSCRGEDDGIKTYEVFKEGLKPVSVDFIQRPISVGKK